MAATTTCSEPLDYEYDVFLSFRGEDTRKNFTDHLYYALKEARIHTFRDDNEIREGEDLSSELLQAIERSRISLVVFSKNSVSSRWCLDELVKIIEFRLMSDQKVLPIFYDVDPSNVRKQRGTFELAFVEHKKRYFSEKRKGWRLDKYEYTVLKWREALRLAATLKGWHLGSTTDG
ncbi:toll/interleukin-1 receptor-like protein [Quercus lobata]|uniref:toll/interleukin-1 receptor-like protein n=1 Tax=Quercus lobata TaxID=97700 RepID=UPI001248C17D|nr:toll/interleukin-1 receptor-like protein [Quercus lobata]